MNLYLISQSVARGYDTYSEAVVAAPDAETARKLHPSGCGLYGVDWGVRYRESSWANHPDAVTADLIGTAVEGTKQGVICASFHAG